MVQGYTAELKRILLANGCRFVRAGKGDHEIWLCPEAKRPFVVDGKIMSRAVANAVLKQAGIKEKL
ncbi:MAG TPA: type II toxin-antitoxin system HicA family toxin [Allosphingosinicella sp.]|uniref:type II toxin-antitoxin system HicA family toxin n=1 Tax=Allosphingosinicella sp. TaxID=2823234 RepID=UPI002F2AD5DF